MSSTRVRLSRSASGQDPEAARGRGGVVFIVPGSASRSGVGVAEVGNHDVGADAGEPLAFPLVHAAGAVVGLVAGHGDGQAADLLGVLDLDVAVAEGEQAARRVISFSRRIRSMTIFLEKCLVVVLSAVDVGAEVAGESPSSSASCLTNASSVPLAR